MAEEKRACRTRIWCSSRSKIFCLLFAAWTLAAVSQPAIVSAVMIVLVIMIMVIRSLSGGPGIRSKPSPRHRADHDNDHDQEHDGSRRFRGTKGLRPTPATTSRSRFASRLDLRMVRLRSTAALGTRCFLPRVLLAGCSHVVDEVRVTSSCLPRRRFGAGDTLSGQFCPRTRFGAGTFPGGGSGRHERFDRSRKISFATLKKNSPSNSGRLTSRKKRRFFFCTHISVTRSLPFLADKFPAWHLLRCGGGPPCAYPWM